MTVVIADPTEDKRVWQGLRVRANVDEPGYGEIRVKLDGVQKYADDLQVPRDNLLLRYAAQDLVGQVADGAKINSWTDRVGGVVAVPSVTYEPRLRLNQANGFPGVEIDRLLDQHGFQVPALDNGNPSWYGYGAKSVFAMVTWHPVIATGDFYVAFSYGRGRMAVGVSASSTPGYGRTTMYSGFNDSVSGTDQVPGSVPSVIGATKSGAATSTPTTIKLWRDGVLRQTGTTSQFASGGMILGAGVGNTTRTMKGLLHEVLFYAEECSEAKALAIQTYLMHKYGTL